MNNHVDRRKQSSSLGQWAGALLALAPLSVMFWVVGEIPITGYN